MENIIHKCMYAYTHKHLHMNYILQIHNAFQHSHAQSDVIWAEVCRQPCTLGSDEGNLKDLMINPEY